MVIKVSPKCLEGFSPHGHVWISNRGTQESRDNLTDNLNRVQTRLLTDWILHVNLATRQGSSFADLRVVIRDELESYISNELIQLMICLQLASFKNSSVDKPEPKSKLPSVCNANAISGSP